jgi:hypothetical protein
MNLCVGVWHILLFEITQLKLNKDMQYKSATPMKLNRITKAGIKTVVVNG